MRVLLPIICSGQARRADGSNSPTALKPRTRRSRPPAPRGWPPPRSDPHLNPIRADSSCKDHIGVLQIVGVIILARLLTPEDFGLVAIVMALTRFAPLLIDFGTADATTQRSRITQGQSSTLFWLTSGIGCAVALGLVACSPFIAWLYHEPRLQSVALCSAITFVLAGISAQHLALLRRTMQFGVIAKIQI